MPGLLRHAVIPVHQRRRLSGTSAIEPQRLWTVVPGHVHPLHHHAEALQRSSDALCQEEGQTHRHQKHQAKHPREAPQEFLLAVALKLLASYRSATSATGRFAAFTWYQYAT